MASARAFLRQRAALPGDIASVVSDVNRQLAADVDASGRFMTLFYLTMDVDAGKIRWVRAGHDPALLYDPVSDTFDELKGPGMALGVDEEWVYEASLRENIAEGQILLLFTDGIWEAHNEAGESFGKEPIHDIIRSSKDRPAQDILNLLLERLTHFTGSDTFEDDVTLVLIKITEGAAQPTA